MDITTRLSHAGFAQHVKNVCRSRHTWKVKCDGTNLNVFSGKEITTIYCFDFAKYKSGSRQLKNPGMKTAMQRYLAWKTLNR